MKKILLSLTVLFTISCNAQQTYPLSNYDTRNLKNGNYIEDTQNVLNQFVGTWEFTSGSTSFRVVLTKEEHWSANGNNEYFTDVIMGGYKYVENNILIIDKLAYTTNFTADTSTWEAFSSILGGVSYPETNKLSISVYDNIKSKDCNATMVLQTNPSGTIQAHWILQDKETSNYHGNIKQQGFSIPTNVILTKLP